MSKFNTKLDSIRFPHHILFTMSADIILFLTAVKKKNYLKKNSKKMEETSKQLEENTISEENKRQQFGNRFLGQEDDVFKHNAW